MLHYYVLYCTSTFKYILPNVLQVSYCNVQDILYSTYCTVLYHTVQYCDRWDEYRPQATRNCWIVLFITTIMSENVSHQLYSTTIIWYNLVTMYSSTFQYTMIPYSTVLLNKFWGALCLIFISLVKFYVLYDPFKQPNVILAREYCTVQYPSFLRLVTNTFSLLDCINNTVYWVLLFTILGH